MASEFGFQLGCDLPQDAKLTGEGWEWRCNADENRTRDVVDTYRELGFEVRLEPLAVDGLSDSCSGCKETLCALNAIYVRKQSDKGAPA